MRPTASTPPHWPDPWTFVQLKGMDQNSCRRPLSQLSNQSLFEVRPRFPQPVSQCSCRGHVLVVLTLMVVCFCTVATGDRSSPRTRRPNPLEIDSAPAAWKCRATKLQIVWRMSTQGSVDPLPRLAALWACPLVLNHVHLAVLLPCQTCQRPM